MAPTTSQQAGLAAAVALAPDRSRGGERAGADARRSRACAPAPSRRPPATTRRAASSAARRSGSSTRRCSPGASPRETLQRGARARSSRGEPTAASAPELISVLAGEDAPLGARRGRGDGQRRRRARAAPRRPARLLVAARGRVAPRAGRSRAARPRYDRRRDHDARRDAGDQQPHDRRRCRPRDRAEPRRRDASARPRAFASTRALEPRRSCSARRCAGRDPRGWPRRSSSRAQKMAAGAARARAATRSATCSSTCPSDSREARTVAALRAGEQATVAVRGAARSPRARCAGGACARWSRRRCSTPPARCARRSSTSPGWSSATRPGRACCCTARPTAAAASASPTTRIGAELRPASSAAGEAPAPAGERRRPLPGGRGRHLDADPHARAGRAGRAAATSPSRCRGHARGARGCPTGPSALAAMHFPRDARRRRERPPHGSPSRSCC